MSETNELPQTMTSQEFVDLVMDQTYNDTGSMAEASKAYRRVTQLITHREKNGFPAQKVEGKKAVIVNTADALDFLENYEAPKRGRNHDPVSWATTKFSNLSEDNQALVVQLLSLSTKDRKSVTSAENALSKLNADQVAEITG